MFKYSLFALIIGFVLDLILGDPRGIPHPVIFIGKEISLLDKVLRYIFPKTPIGERMAGVVLWLLVTASAALIPFFLLVLCYKYNPLIGLALESIMSWQILAIKSLKQESMKVYRAIKSNNIDASRYNLSMIVGRDTSNLDNSSIIRAAVETIAENTSDGVIAPLLFLAVGGAPLGFLYKAVNTMDSMLGYTDIPYTNIGFFPAKADDVFNYIPSRISAITMLIAGGIMRLNIRNGWKIFLRDRYRHPSPNSAQTESVCAGLLGIQLGGPSYYRGILHEKQYIGDNLREIQTEDIPLANRLLYLTGVISLFICVLIKLPFILKYAL